MTQFDDKLIELINAGMDNQLSDTQRDQLEQRLHADPKAGLLQQELQQVGQALDQLEPVTPPRQIRDHILDAAAPTASSITLRLITALLPSAAIPRYAMAFVGGLVFGAAALQLGEGYRSEMDPTQFVGTLTDYGTLPHAITTDRFSVELDQISGSVRLHRIDNMLVVDFKLESPQAVNVVTAYQGQQVTFKGMSLLESKLSSFSAENERISMVADGQHHYSLFLENRQQRQSNIEISFLTDGSMFHQETLMSPAVE